MKPQRLIYVPLEPYQERYTQYQSCAGGVIERQLKELNVPFVAIRPHQFTPKPISTGVVLDPVHRCRWAFQQTQELVEMIVGGEITDSDVIYFEDFWHPGMEMIPYAASLANVSVPLYGFNFAQSVDRYDFTAEWKWWIRPFEKAWANCLSAVFCASRQLEELMVTGWERQCKYYTVGLPYDHRVVWEQASITDAEIERARTSRSKMVIYSSRWDREKHPEIFCQLATMVLKERKDIQFHVCTGAPLLRSNSSDLSMLAMQMQQDYPRHFYVHTHLTKAEYFEWLLMAKVQFNCSDQDWVAYTLLDATAFGCMPLYPKFLSFPDALHHRKDFLYTKNNVGEARDLLYKLIDGPQLDVSWVYEKYERSIHRQVWHMGFDVPKPRSLAEEIQVVEIH